MAVWVIGARGRVEKPKISFEPSCAAANESGRIRAGVLGPCPRSGRPGGGIVGVDAHGDDIVQPARPRVGQVVRGTGRTARSDRALAEIDIAT